MNLNFKNNKKGAFFDTFFFFVVIVILLISGIFLTQILSPLVARFQADPNLGTEAQGVLDSASHIGTIQDQIVLIVFIILWIVVLVAGYQIDSNPVFFIIMAVIMLIFTMTAGMIGELTSELFNDPLLATGATEMPVSNFLAQHLFMVVIAIGFSVMLVMYAKRSNPQ